jgi:hypothetical protein
MRPVVNGGASRKRRVEVEVTNIEALFEADGWKLELEERERDDWIAWFWFDSGGTYLHEAHGRTRLGAAEAAWGAYVSEVVGALTTRCDEWK